MRNTFTRYWSEVASVAQTSDNLSPGGAGAKPARFGISLLMGLTLAATSAAQPRSDDLKGIEAAERSLRAGTRATATQAAGERRTPVIVNGRSLTWEDLHPALAEAAGGLVLQELVLDRRLEDAMDKRGLTITPGDVARERQLLVEAIVQEARASADDAERLLATVQRSRGLGEHRFAQLLERNARLRALVAPDVEIEREEIDREYLIRHGPRYRARVIMTATERQAVQIRRSLERTEEHLAMRFAEAAATESIDPSAARGGIVDPISPADPSYPTTIRRSLEQLAPGEMSPVLAVDRGFALLLLDERLPGDDVELPDVEPQIRTDVLRRAERLAMDALARQLLREADISIMDRHLDWSWRGLRGER